MNKIQVLIDGVTIHESNEGELHVEVRRVGTLETVYESKKGTPVPIPPAQNYICPMCGLAYVTQAMLDSHMTVHAAPAGKPIPPFPLLWFGPKPATKEEFTKWLTSAIEIDYKPWHDYILTAGADIDWMWQEYKNVNGGA
jgi:hypothetical protein